ncbi:MAG: pyridoxamine kinase [Oscillospiraceae bacterium]
MKRIASIQDISCLGRCSLTVALPVISAMAVECAIVPTAVLSTHTMFPGFISRDLSDQLLPIARHWKSQNVTLDAICTGYLASPRQTEEVCDFFDLLAGPDTLLFVDPAMADGGRLYSGFGPDFPAYMRRVVSRAHVAVPNVTEACLLTDTPYRETEDLSWWRDLLRRVGDLGPRCPVLTGVPFGPDRLGVMALDPESGGIFQYHTPRVHDHFHGTGDIFSAACAGAMVRAKACRRLCAWRRISPWPVFRSPAGTPTPPGTGWSLRRPCTCCRDCWSGDSPLPGRFSGNFAENP